MVSIVGLNKAAVLAVLYNASRPQGMGFLSYKKEPMTIEEAAQYLERTTYFDYLGGRVMKIDLKSDENFDEWGYDRDNGEGAARRAVDSLRTTAYVNAPDVQATHDVGKALAAQDVFDNVDEPNTMTGPVLEIGLRDVADILIPAVESAVFDSSPDASGDSSPIDTSSSSDSSFDPGFSGGESGGGGASGDF